MTRLTADQLQALATLIRARPGATLAAAQRVLVGGERQADAARAAGVSAASLHNCVTRLRRALELARRAVG